MRDLASLDVVTTSNEGFDLKLYNPAGTLEDLGIVITILGRDSTEFRKLQSAQNQRRMAKLQKSGATRSVLSLDELEQDTIQILAACTKAWKTQDGESFKELILVGGVELACTRENAVRLYTDYPWIKEQVEAGITDRANFIKR